jgi:aldoxime dehydratase
VAQRSKPDDFEPPYPAYQAHPPEAMPEVVIALFAVQARGEAESAAIVEQIAALLDAPLAGRPLHFDISSYADAAGAENLIHKAYWASVSDQTAFWNRGDVRAFLSAPMTGDCGWWVESFHAPTTSLDGNYAVSDVKYGIGRHSTLKEERFHAYMGSMRDRVPDYLSGVADGPEGRLARIADKTETLGQTLRVTDLPPGLCYIRSGFAWKNADPSEQAAFLKDMMPVFEDGADYLRDNPVEANCISMRKTEEHTAHFDNEVQSNSIGWFLTLRDLEYWVRAHPRHLAIMDTIMGYMARFNFQPKLNLGHEVVVVPEGQLLAIYANCHAETGFLPYFPARNLSLPIG